VEAKARALEQASEDLRDWRNPAYARADAQLPRGSTLDIVLEHALMLDSDQIQYRHVGDSSPITPPPSRPE